MRKLAVACELWLGENGKNCFFARQYGYLKDCQKGVNEAKSYLPKL